MTKKSMVDDTEGRKDSIGIYVFFYMYPFSYTTLCSLLLYGAASDSLTHSLTHSDTRSHSLTPLTVLDCTDVHLTHSSLTPSPWTLSRLVLSRESVCVRVCVRCPVLRCPVHYCPVYLMIHFTKTYCTVLCSTLLSYGVNSTFS